MLAIPSLFQDGALIVLGLLWLAIPIIAALTIDTKVTRNPDPEGRDEAPAHSKVHSRPRSRGLTEDT